MDHSLNTSVCCYGSFNEHHVQHMRKGSLCQLPRTPLSKVPHTNSKNVPMQPLWQFFLMKTRLNQHMMAKHNDNPHLIPNENLCIEWGKTFVSAERLQEQKANMHTVDEITLTCRVSKKDFRNGKVYKRHSRKYHLELPCTECEKKFGL